MDTREDVINGDGLNNGEGMNNVEDLINREDINNTEDLNGRIILDEQNDKSKKYTRFKYTEEDLVNALESVKSKKLSLNKAALQYNIPKSTLSNKLNGKTIEGRRMGPPPVLTTAEEKYLEDWIIGKAKIGLPMHKDDVKDSVCNVIKSIKRKNPFVDDRPGEKWVSLFMKRHPTITQRNTETINKGKACITEESIRDWFNDLKGHLKEENCCDILMDGDRIFNADETGVECCPKTGKVMGPKNYKDFYSIAPGKEKESITVLANFSASGRKVPPMIVLPYKRIPRDVAESVPANYFIGRSDSGWMVAATFYEYVANCFYPWLVENSIQFPILLLLDGHKSHINLDLSKFCSEKKIILYGLLPNATNILQPCDVGVFRPLKAAWKVAVRKWKLKHDNSKTLSKINFTPIFQEAFEASIDSAKIQNAFKKSGIFPFNVENVDFNKCMQKRHRELRNVEFKTSEENANMLFFNTLQSEIPEALLQNFEKAEEDKTTDIQEPVLFSIWKKYKPTEIQENHVQLNELEISSTEDNSNILEIDIDPSNHDENSNPNQPDKTIQTTILNNNTELQHYTEPVLLPALITAGSSNVAPSTPKPLQSIASTSTEAQGISKQFKKLDDIWKEHLSWPNISRQIGTSKKSMKRKIPFAITSKKWQEIHEAEKLEKETKENLKQKRKEEREAKKQKKNDESKKKKEAKKKLSKKMQEDEEETPTEDEDEMSLHDSDESINNFEDLIKYTLSQKSDSESEAENNTNAFLDKVKVNKTFVIVEYEKEFFPGIVTQRKGKKFEVSTLSMCNVQGLNWKWPVPEDKIWYLAENIKEIIEAPKLLSATSSRSSGVYSVPELDKYRKFNIS